MHLDLFLAPELKMWVSQFAVFPVRTRLQGRPDGREYQHGDSL